MMRKRNKNPTKTTETNRDSIINYMFSKDFETILDLKDRFYLDQEWADEILDINNGWIRDKLIFKHFKCPYCLEDLEYVTEKNNHGERCKEPILEYYGYYKCPHGHEIY